MELLIQAKAQILKIKMPIGGREVVCPKHQIEWQATSDGAEIVRVNAKAAKLSHRPKFHLRGGSRLGQKG